MAGNEANFFVRDVTNGSTLPFRIFPGNSSNVLNIKSSAVGVGTTNPVSLMHVRSTVSNTAHMESTTDKVQVKFQNADNQNGFLQYNLTSFRFFADSSATPTLVLSGGSPGNIGQGVLSPAHPLEMASGAHITSGGAVNSASSREWKEDIRALSATDARTALSGLEPVRFAYKAEPGESYVGFIAEDVPDLVATSDRKGLAAMDVVAVLTKVVQEQEEEIASQQERISRQNAAISELAVELAE